MQASRKILLLVLAIFLFSTTYATNYYVDLAATGSNNGSSWTNAWETFGDINWSSLSAGDTLFISGGADSVTYTEALGNTTSNPLIGTEASPIVISKGNTSGHNGLAIFDGDWGNNGNGGIMLDFVGCKYLKITGLKVVAGSCRAYGEVGSPSKCITWDNITVIGVGREGGIEASGWQASGNLGLMDSTIIQNCTVINDIITDIQSDLIDVNIATNTFIRGCYLYQRNNNNHHVDAIQTQNRSTGLEISGCYIEHRQPPSPVYGWADNGLMIQDTDGFINIYNNVINFMTHSSWFDGSEWKQTNGVWIEGGYDATTYGNFYNNTVLLGTVNWNAWFIDFSKISVKNNIFYCLNNQNNTASISFSYNTPPPEDSSDYNLFYYPNSNGSTQNVVDYVGSGYRFPEWQTVGGDLHGIYGNPLFINPVSDWQLEAGSPAINAGVDLPAPYNVDINGVTRQSGHFTLGAYEYEGPTTVADQINNELPNEYLLYQNYPNPFNPSTIIRFSMPIDQPVKISIYNVLGELFAELTNQGYDAGTHTINFDGSTLNSGIYFYRIETPEFIETKKMILIK